MNVHINVRAPAELVKNLDQVVKKGRYKNRSDAVNEALELLIRREKLLELEEKMKKIRSKTVKYPSLTQAVLEAREEEDDRI